MNIIQRLKDKNLWFNLGIFVIAVIVLFFILNLLLSFYTNHGQSQIVPDLRGMTIEEVKKVCEERNLRYQIRDTVYVSDKPKLTILEQNPKSGAKVKKGRRIYITLNADKAPLVALPSEKSLVYNRPLNEVSSLLENLGFIMGTPISRPNMAEGAVLELQLKGKVLELGTMLPKGTVITPVIGEKYTLIPNLTNSTLDGAKFILKGYELMLGQIHFDNDDKDTSKAIIYKQKPLNGQQKISVGTPIEVWLKKP